MTQIILNLEQSLKTVIQLYIPLKAMYSTTCVYNCTKESIGYKLNRKKGITTEGWEDKEHQKPKKATCMLQGKRSGVESRQIRGVLHFLHDFFSNK